MSKLSPVDDEILVEGDEFFEQSIGDHAIPNDDAEHDTYIHCPPEEVAANAVKQITKRAGNARLSEINVSFEYTDGEGYTTWENVIYTLRIEPEIDG